MCQISCAVCHLGTTLHTGVHDLRVAVLCIGPSARSEANDFILLDLKRKPSLIRIAALQRSNLLHVMWQKNKELTSKASGFNGTR